MPITIPSTPKDYNNYASSHETFINTLTSDAEAMKRKAENEFTKATNSANSNASTTVAAASKFKEVIGQADMLLEAAKTIASSEKDATGAAFR